MQKPKLKVVNSSVEVQNEWPNVPLAMYAPLGEGRVLRGNKMMATLSSRRFQSKETASLLVMSRLMATGGLRVQKIIIFHSNIISKK